MIFSGIVGQPKAVNLLGRALDSGRLAHAYLFSGPDGVGKQSTAMALVAWLFCTSGAEGPCGRCGGCVKFRSGNHPDYTLIRPEGAGIKIDQVRELKRIVTFSPFEAPRRIVVMEDVHTMRREAGNSLLKLLEEPPPDNLLLLLASDSEPLLPTIVSRCQVIPFYPLSGELAAEVIQGRKPELSREEALVLAELADGAPGKALAMADSGLLEMRRRIVDELLGPQESRPKQVEKALLLATGVADLQENLASFFELMKIYFKETMIAALGGRGRRRCPVEIEKATERWSLEQLSDKVHSLEFAVKALDRNCNRALVCEALFLKLLAT